jgi:DNA-binding transcriptional LysR family regulator
MALNHERLLRFATVVDEGSFSRAAVQLGLSQPALSACIRQLEGELGVRLLERGRHGAVATAAGAVLYERAKRVASEVSAALGELKALSSGRGKRLAVGAVSGAAMTLVCTTICRLVRAHPNLAVELADEPSETALLDRLARGNLDLVVCPTFVGSEQHGLRSHALFRSRRLAAIRPGHPVARKRDFALTDLLSYPFVHLDPAAPMHHSVDELFRRLGLDPPAQNISANSIAAGKDIVMGSDAFSIFSELSIAAELERGMLVGSPVERASEAWWSLFWSDREISPVMRSFVQDLCTVCAAKSLALDPRFPAAFAA